MNFLLSISLVTWPLMDINAQVVSRPGPYCGSPDMIRKSIKAVSESELHCSLKLYKHSIEGMESLALSTASACISLWKIYYGSTGQIREKLRDILELRDENCKIQYGLQNFMDRINYINIPHLGLANEIFYGNNRKLKPNYSDILNTTFRSTPQKFRTSNAKKIINDWYENHTLEKYPAQNIKNLMGNESLVIAGNSYYYNTWIQSFDLCGIKLKSFHYDNKNYGVGVYMRKTDTYKWGNLAEADAQFVEIPWKVKGSNIDISLFIILPNKIDGLRALEDKITVEMIREQLFRGIEHTVYIELVRFRVNSAVNLFQSLRNMKLSLRFNETAKYKEIIEDSEVSIDDIRDSAVIGFPISRLKHFKYCSDNDRVPVSKVFNVDHPFMMVYVIRDDNPVILSMARVTEFGDERLEA